jgi:hypothetical protein
MQRMSDRSDSGPDISNLRTVLSLEGLTLLLMIALGGGGAGVLGARFGDALAEFLGSGPAARAIGALPFLFMMIFGMFLGILAWSWIASRLGFDQARVRRLVGRDQRGRRKNNSPPPAA